MYKQTHTIEHISEFIAFTASRERRWKIQLLCGRQSRKNVFSTSQADFRVLFPSPPPPPNSPVFPPALLIFPSLA